MYIFCQVKADKTIHSQYPKNKQTLKALRGLSAFEVNLTGL